jgi:prepilin-type N-terminal cleavage/methylation domain-containing protein
VRKASGFTLIELMTVIFMLALLSAFAVPGIISWRSAAKLRAAAENLKGNLELAKLKAIQENGPVAVHFKENGYQIFVDTGATAGILDADERLMKNISLPVGIKFAPKTFGEAGDTWPRKTRFFGRGTADNGTAFLKDEKRTEGKKIIISNLAKITIEKYKFE